VKHVLTTSAERPGVCEPCPNGGVTEGKGNTDKSACLGKLPDPCCDEQCVAVANPETTSVEAQTLAPEITLAPGETTPAPAATPPPPPPPTTLPPEIVCGLAGGTRIGGFRCDFYINIRCQKWRDEGYSWSTSKQRTYLSECMAQDCEQSMEPLDSQKDTLTAEGIPLTPGCRYVDKYGFCYTENAAQMWCKENPTSHHCDGSHDPTVAYNHNTAGRHEDTHPGTDEIEQGDSDPVTHGHDGGAVWARTPLGSALAESPGARSTEGWKPGTFKYMGNGNDGTTSCACMKDCTCRLSSRSWKCYCVDKDQTPVGPGEAVPSSVIRSSR